MTLVAIGLVVIVVRIALPRSNAWLDVPCWRVSRYLKQVAAGHPRASSDPTAAS